MIEEGPKHDRSPIVIHRILGDTLELNKLFDYRKSEVLEKASKAINSYTTEEITSLASKLISAQAKDDEFWNVDRRDGALELLKHVPLERAIPEKLRDVYLRTISQQGEEIDPLDSAEALINTGKIIYSHIPKGKKTHQKIGQAWNTVSSKMKDNPLWLTLEQKIAKEIVIFEPKRGRRKTPDAVINRRKKVVIFWNQGKSRPEIAEELGSEKSLIDSDIAYLRKSGVKLGRRIRKSKRALEEVAMQREQETQLWREGKSMLEIANTLGISEKLVKSDLYYLRKQGVNLERRKSDSTNIALRRENVAVGWQSGKNINDIAEELGISSDTVFNDIRYLREHNVHLEKRRTNKSEVAARREEVIRLWRSGKGYAEIAEELQVPVTKIKNDLVAMRRIGVNLELRSGPSKTKRLSKPRIMIQPKRRNPTAEQIAKRRQKVANFWETNKTSTEIAIAVRTSENVVRNDLAYLREQGVSLQRRMSSETENVERREKVADLLKTDKTYPEIAEELGVSISKVNNDIEYLKKHGESIKRIKSKEEIEARQRHIAKLLEQSKSRKEIAKELKISQMTVRRDIYQLRKNKANEEKSS